MEMSISNRETPSPVDRRLYPLDRAWLAAYNVAPARAQVRPDR
jgi:hypothetical protein